ncbi:MAG: hypothetical protein ABII12_17955 [Planctomycetota bacterium]
MLERKPKPLYIAVAVIWTIVTYAAIVHGETTFYIQREGSPEDTGLTLFTTDAGEYFEEDFEDPELGPVYGEVPELWFGELGLQLVGDWNGPNPPTLFQSSAFNQEGKLFGRVLFPGFALTVTPIDNAVVQAFGCWIFDDGGSLDSAYRLDVVETNGAASSAILENEIDRDNRGHEIEGFIGVISEVGILSLTITPIDPETGTPIGDVFEVDHWMVALFQQPANECELCGDLDDDGDVDTDDYWIILTSFGRSSEDEAFYPCTDLDGDGRITLADYAQWRICYQEANGEPPPFQDPCSRYGKEAHRASPGQLHRRSQAEFGAWPPRKSPGPWSRSGTCRKTWNKLP